VQKIFSARRIFRGGSGATRLRLAAAAEGSTPASILVHQLRNLKVMGCNQTIINYAQLHIAQHVLRSADTIYQSYFQVFQVN
jgi:hypothetical protein